MSPTFWSNTIWFILLGISTIIELIFIIFKAKDRKLVFGLYLTISALTFCFEMVVLSLLKAYEYHPMLIPQSPPDDSIAGNLFSQFSVSATALLIAVYNLKYYWYFFFAAVYGIIEELFIKLGIYEHNWYRTWMTFFGLLLLFWVAKKIYAGSLKHIGRFLRYLYIFLGLITLHEHTIVWVLRLTGIRKLSGNFLPDKEDSLTVLAGIYMLIVGISIITVYFSKIKWFWKGFIILLLYLGHYIATRFNLIIYKEGWFLVASSISIWSMYFYTFILDKLYTKTEEYL